jgi:predicted MPP superfamily phosphohydrolase
MLIRMFNKLSKNTKETVEEYIDKFNELHDYVYDYFDNLDVQEEINNKLDDMARDGSLTALIKAYVDPIQEEFENGINATLDAMNTKINNAVGISPIPVASTASMTDTTKVYVNTTDGKWYYWSGSAWLAGGTYQGTEPADSSVSLNSMTAIPNIKYKKFGISDLYFVKGYSRYNGNLVQDANASNSSCFKVSKGTTIVLSDEEITVRYTLYSLDGSYVSNTGTFRNIPSYVVPQDGILCITFMGDVSDAPDLFTIVGVNNSDVTLDFHFFGSSIQRLESEAVYLTKGSTIQPSDYGIYNSGNNLSDGMIYIGYNEYGKDKTSRNYINFNQDANYSNQKITIAHDGYYKFYIRIKGGKTITEDDIPKISNSIEVLTTDNKQNNFLINKFYHTYISNDSAIEIKKSSSGKLLFRIINPEEKLIIRESNSIIYERSFNEMLEDLSSDTETVDGITYLRLLDYGVMRFDFFFNTVKIERATLFGTPCIPLLVNSYANVCGGELVPIWLRQQTPSSEIFNSIAYISGTNWQSGVKAHSSHLNTEHTDIEPYVFFTDPHLTGGADNLTFSSKLNPFIGTLQKYYNSSPNSFIVCGGDWLNNTDSPDTAEYKLGYVTSSMNTMFKNYYGLVGNHDTNYQGTEELSQQAINNVMYKGDKAYYSFKGLNSTCYCLDSGKDGAYNAMNSYRWEQIKWLGDKLVEDDAEHSIVFIHIISEYRNEEYETAPMADNLTKLIYAYNEHSTVTLNSVSYDFTNCSGKVHYVLGGHIHNDYSNTINGVLCIMRDTFAYGKTTPTFDQIFNDYDEGKAYFTRVGTGESAEFNI